MTILHGNKFYPHPADDGFNISDAEMSQRRKAMRMPLFQEQFDAALDEAERLGFHGQAAEDFLVAKRIEISVDLDKLGL